MSCRTDWTRTEVAALFDLPFPDLLFDAQSVHRSRHDPNRIELATLLSIKTGGCAENCGYCSQSAHHNTGLKATKLMGTKEVVDAARAARAAGSARFCMGAAWRSPKDRDMNAIIEMVSEVRALGLETCMTLGMLSDTQAERLAEAGLDYYNHNLDTAPEHYSQVVTTRSWDDRIETLDRVRTAGIKVCCGGIIGMGESRAERVGFVHALATLPEHPASVPINALVPIAGTPIEAMLRETGLPPIDEIEFVRTVAVARITMPDSVLRLSAGRESMTDAAQALCFLAGANSIFTGDRLLTSANCGETRDAALLAQLGISSGSLSSHENANGREDRADGRSLDACGAHNAASRTSGQPAPSNDTASGEAGTLQSVSPHCGIKQLGQAGGSLAYIHNHVADVVVSGTR